MSTARLVKIPARRFAFCRTLTMASVLVALLSACGIGADLRSYSATKRPRDAAEEIRSVFDGTRTALGGRARAEEKIEFESCGGFWKDVQGDPLGVDISPYPVSRRMRLDVDDTAEAVSAMAAVRDQLVRSGWAVTLDEIPASAGGDPADPNSPAPGSGGMQTSDPLPHVVLRSADGNLSVSADLAHQTVPSAVDVTVRSGCYRHPDEKDD